MTPPAPGRFLCDMHGISPKSLIANDTLIPGYVCVEAFQLDLPDNKTASHLLDDLLTYYTCERRTAFNKYLYVINIESISRRIIAAYQYDGMYVGFAIFAPLTE